ncbi:sodium channel protein Nach [Andrena cerasifolii]|uniref:sodium channel protein Nach n=1 Tax=Andrena cerasifolii TaxID=2819439 RepID=UPI004037C012
MFIHEQLYNWNWGKSIDSGPSKAAYETKNNFRSTFEPLIPDCDNLISNCTYRGIKVPCGKLFTKVLVSVGACCKFNALGPLKVMDLSWDLEFETTSSSYPWRLYFTPNVESSPKPGERPIAKVYFPIDIEFIVDITYTTPDIRYLTLRQRECYFKQEGVRSLNDCEMNCFIDRLLARCNCLPWFLSSIDKAECPVSKYSCLNNTSANTNQCKCWISCDHTSYTVKGMIKSTTNVTRIMLRKWPTALYKREMRFGYLDLLVSFGGIAGLFLGYSLLTSVELGYYFSLRTYCGAVIRSSRNRYNIITVHVVEKLPRKTDLKPQYYQYVN